MALKKNLSLTDIWMVEKSPFSDQIYKVFDGFTRFEVSRIKNTFLAVGLCVRFISVTEKQKIKIWSFKYASDRDAT